jgi:shikimate kinase / 3-dehydroquinate synthase
VAPELNALGSERGARAGSSRPGGAKIVLIGFMGAGKSTAARGLGRDLGVGAADVDEVIEQRLGASVQALFARDGEAAFRAAEEQITLELLRAPGDGVVALGGGAVMREAVRTELARHQVVWLDVARELAWQRCEEGGRPLAGDPAGFATLHAEREPIYAALADIEVPAARSGAVAEVLAAAEGLPRAMRLIWATSASADYPVYIGPGLLESSFWPATAAGRRFLVTDGHVGRLYRDTVAPLCGEVMIVPGESSKTVAHAEIVWTELARAGLTRQDLVVALGGGVVGDLAGFCAATYQRGVRYVQVPTTLLAQVDSAYGGKTGVDLEEAKNYVGAFHQPSAVLCDTDALSSLPPAELAAGYAEVVKTALIAGGDLWQRVRAGADPATAQIIAACARTKLRIVAADERDGGLRQVLNLGHTVAHAIETVTRYSAYRHGEAVALGLLVALRLSDAPDLRDDVAELLAAHGLPTVLEHADPDAVVMATRRDKKRMGEGPVPFVLLDTPGAARPGCAVDPRALVGAVRELATP